MAISKIGLTTGITGTLPTANGGTGATSFVSGKVLQVVSTALTSVVSISVPDGTTPSNVSGLSVLLTYLHAYQFIPKGTFKNYVVKRR